MAGEAPVRWGILGAARINELVVSACRGSRQLEFVAVASRDQSRAQAHADALGVPRACGSYDELLAVSDIDAVYVPLPNAMHVEWSIKALEAGKHVLCEKPFSSDPHAVERAFAVAQERSLLLAEAFMYRSHPQTDILRDVVGSGRIGKLAFIHAELMFAMERNPTEFRLQAAMEGGALMDLGCYCVNAARLLAGEPEHLEAVAWRFGEETDIRFAGALELPDGVMATFHCAFDLPLRSRLEIVGTRGSISVDDPWQCLEGSISVLDEQGREERITAPSIDRYRAQFEAFSRAIESDGALEFGASDAIAQAAVLNRLLSEARIAG